MSNPPAFQFYPKQWLGDDMVALMDLCAQGAHLRLMCFAWQQSPPCTLPNDLGILAKWCGMNSEQFAPIWSQVLMAWSLRNDRWLSVGLYREWKKQKEFSKRQSQIAQNRWKNKPNNDNATAMPRHSHGNAKSGIARASNALLLQSSSSSSEVTTPPIAPQGATNGFHRKRPKAKPERRIEFWQSLVDHIDQSWKKRKGTSYPWDAMEFKKLHGLAIVYQAWGVMGMWDLYVQMGTYWGKLTGFMLDGLKKDIGVIVDDPRWKSLSQSYEEKLFKPTGDQMVPTKDVLTNLVASVKEIP